MMPGLSPSRSLVAVKLLHSVIWAFFAGCIIAVPIYAWLGRPRLAAALIAVVFGEVAVLLLNRMRCPLTDVASRYTDDRRDNFDIYLPLWVARHNKTIFGLLYVAGIAVTIARWG